MDPTTFNLDHFDSLWDYDHPAETEQHFQALLPRAESQPALQAELLTQIARAQGLQRHFDEAHRTLNIVESRLSADMPRVQIRYFLERGRVFNSSGSPERAVPFFRQAWELARSQDEDFYAVDALHMLAIAAPPDEQLDWNLKALDLAEDSDDERARRWKASLYNNIGWTYHEQGEYEKALVHFQKALDERIAAGQPSQVWIARWCVARCQRSIGLVAEAYAEQQKLLAEAEAAGEEAGYTLEELGECLLLLGHPEEARPWFARAYQSLSRDPWLVEREPARLARLQELGNE